MIKSYKFIYASMVLALVLSLGAIAAPLQMGAQKVGANGSNTLQLSNGFVGPNDGDTLTNFYYYVSYYDSGGSSPSVRQVYIDGIAHEMSLLSGSASDGVYRYGPKNLAIGSHNYWFYFEDGKGGTAKLPEVGSYFGPEVIAGPGVIWNFPYGTQAYLCPAPADGRPYLGAVANLPTGTAEPAQLLGVYWLDEVAREWRYYYPRFTNNTLNYLEPERAYLVAVSGTCSWQIPQG